MVDLDWKCNDESGRHLDEVAETVTMSFVVDQWWSGTAMSVTPIRRQAGMARRHRNVPSHGNAARQAVGTPAWCRYVG